MHERLAAEGELDIGSAEPKASRLHGGGFATEPPGELEPPAPLGEVGLHGVPRPRRWDAVATAEAELPGEAVHFVALPDGTLVVDEDVPDGGLGPLADAIEATIDPPYRAQGIRRGQSVWAVGAKRIEVRELPGHDGDELELVEGDEVLLGRRLDGDLWEVEVSRL